MCHAVAGAALALMAGCTGDGGGGRGPGPATALAVTVQPTDATAGSVILPTVEVAIQDESGITVAAATDAVTVAIGDNPSSGTLSGTLTVDAVSGVATFSDLSIDADGVGYTLAFSAAGLTPATSGAFDVTLLPPAPGGVLALAGDGQVDVVWNVVSGATSYNIYRAAEAGVTPANYAALSEGAQHADVTSPYTVTGLANGTPYYFVVTAVNAMGEGGASAEASATPTSGNQPPTITDLSANPPTITTSETSIVTVTALDPEGDPLSYSWFQNSGGAITGSGASVTYWPASCCLGTWTITVTVSDGRGGSAQQSVNVTVQ